jgi:hypothetical protein
LIAARRSGIGASYGIGTPFNVGGLKPDMHFGRTPGSPAPRDQHEDTRQTQMRGVRCNRQFGGVLS